MSNSGRQCPRCGHSLHSDATNSGVVVLPGKCPLCGADLRTLESGPPLTTEPPTVEQLARRAARRAVPHAPQTESGYAPSAAHEVDEEIAGLTGGLFSNALQSPLTSLQPVTSLGLSDAPPESESLGEESPFGRRRRGWVLGGTVVALAVLAFLISVRPSASSSGAAPPGSARGVATPAAAPSEDINAAIAPSPSAEGTGEPAPVPVPRVESAEPPSTTPAPVARTPVSKEVTSAKEGSDAPPTRAVTRPAPSDETEDDDAPPFDRQAASTAVSAASATAASCRQTEYGSGSARVALTFASTGRVTQATIEPGSLFLGTPVAGCVISKMRSVRVPPFSGDKVTVHVNVAVE